MTNNITTEILDAVTAHGEAEGRQDYNTRAADVARGEDPTWAWPLADADSAYISAVGTGAICRAVGLPASAWDDVAEKWCAAFRAGYEAEAAHDEPTKIDHLTEAQKHLSTARRALAAAVAAFNAADMDAFADDVETLQADVNDLMGHTLIAIEYRVAKEAKTP